MGRGGEGGSHVPTRCMINKAVPMSRGAMKETRLFSTASIRMVIISMDVRIASIMRPEVVLTPVPNEFSAWSFPGRTAETIPAAAIPPRNCAGMTQTRRTQLNAPASQSPKEICPRKSELPFHC